MVDLIPTVSIWADTSTWILVPAVTTILVQDIRVPTRGLSTVLTRTTGPYLRCNSSQHVCGQLPTLQRQRACCGNRRSTKRRQPAQAIKLWADLPPMATTEPVAKARRKPQQPPLEQPLRPPRGRQTASADCRAAHQLQGGTGRSPHEIGGAADGAGYTVGRAGHKGTGDGTIGSSDVQTHTRTHTRPRPHTHTRRRLLSAAGRPRLELRP